MYVALYTKPHTLHPEPINTKRKTEKAEGNARKPLAYTREAHTQGGVDEAGAAHVRDAFSPSLDALSVRSDAIRSTKIPEFSVRRGMLDPVP